MFDTRMIGIPNRIEKGTVEIDLPRGWIDFSSAPFRQADVGAPVLVYVAVLSAHEATAINAAFKREAAATLRARLAERGPDYLGCHLDQQALQGAERVEKLLEHIQQEGYFSSWVVVEACTID